MKRMRVRVRFPNQVLYSAGRRSSALNLQVSNFFLN